MKVIVITDTDGAKYVAGTFRSEWQAKAWADRLERVNPEWVVEVLVCQRPEHLVSGD